MAGIGELLKAGQGIAGMAGSAVGGVFSAIAAKKQINVAKNQLREGRAFNSSQQREYGRLYDDLLSKAQNQSTYKADTSAYQKVVSEAERQKREAATSINPADAMMREDARLSTANMIGAASRGARSATDLLSIAGSAYGNERASMRGINTQNAQDAFSRGQQSSNNLLNSLGDLANATARERGLEFESLFNKEQGILGLTRDKGLGGMDLAYRGQQEDFARRAALVDSQASLFNGVGDVFRSVGQGFTNYQLANKQMGMLRTSAASAPSADFGWLNQYQAQAPLNYGKDWGKKAGEIEKVPIGVKFN